MNGNKKPMVAVSFNVSEESKKRIETHLSSVASVVFIKDLAKEKRAAVLREAKAIFSWVPHNEFSSDEEKLLERVDFLQLLSAGVDHIDFNRLPENLIVASNVGAYAQPMAEHTLAMVLALCKRFLFYQEQLKNGIFDQFSENKTLYGTTAAILGFGGIGKEVAKLFTLFDMHILAINRSGKTEEAVDFIGTLDDLEKVLPRADIIVISLPLNKATRGLIGEKELKMMKSDAILVNVGRGEIIDEKAFYEHLKKTETFLAGIDAWWVEPIRHGRFEMKYPFLDLPNVLGTPHNSALVPGALEKAVEEAVKNIRRFLMSQPIIGHVKREDYI